MSYLLRKTDNAVTQNFQTDSIEYQTLIHELSTTTGLPIFEEIAEEDVLATAVRLWVINNPGATILADEIASGYGEPGRPGTITSVVYYANSPGIVGAATNSRTITVVQGTAQGAGSPARTTLATLALVAGVNAPTNQASSAFTINSAAFIADAPLEVVSTHIGTGIADPGGLVAIAYTPV